MRRNNFFRWLTVPPVVAVLTIMLARTMGTGDALGEVDISVWSIVWLLFIVMSVLYGMFIMHGFGVGLIALQALAQGIILCPVSIVCGARMFQWLGVVMAVCGAAALVVYYNQAEAEKNRVVVTEVEDDLKKLPVNFAITDDTGTILNLTEDMLKVLGLSRVDSISKNIGQWFSPVAKTAEINGKIWDIKRKVVSEGRRYYFELNPKLLTQNDSDGTDATTGSSVGSSQFYDPDTQLHTYTYGMSRIADELYRAGRYGRSVSAVMIRIVFPQLLPEDDMEKYIRPFRAYCARVIKDIRQSDTAIQTGESQLMVVMSECPYQMAEEVTRRLTGIVNALCPTFPEFMNVTVLNVSESIEGGNNVPSAQELVDRMTYAMTRKYSANALSE